MQTHNDLIQDSSYASKLSSFEIETWPSVDPVTQLKALFENGVLFERV